MADAQQQDAANEEDTFIDESGKTSLEPEGAGHHPHSPGEHHRHPPEGWYPTPDPQPHDRWEAAPDRSEAYDRDEGGLERGRRPVEGDGVGMPE
ncbi:MAG: hypothetical protein M3Y08_06105 [Fibrobacterota bacterium]|nr:hypothetical protein [Fibrobacterota bacterium]